MTNPVQRCVLIVSPQFPPSPLAGTHRARHLAKHLPAHGWHAIVIRVDEAFYREPLDPALAALMPADIEQVRVPALNARWARLAGVGDVGLRAYSAIGAAIDQAVVEHRPEVVFITGFPFYPMLLAGRIRQRHRLPVVLDFQDPWVSAFGATQSPFSKAGIAHRLAVVLEPRALRHASFVTGVSDAQNAEMARRYPWLDTARMAAIPIGGDPEDFAAATPTERGGEGVELRYLGAYWPRAEPCVRALMRGLARLRAEQPGLVAGLTLSFTGTSTAHGGDAAPPKPVEAIARQERVDDHVRERPQRAPFVEALGLMAAAQGLLLVGSDEPHYTASKIYPALMSGRPYLSIFHARSSAHQILSQAGGGIALGFEDQAELDALTPRIAQALRRLAAEPGSFAPADPAAYAAYTASAVSGRFAAIFDQVAQCA